MVVRDRHVGYAANARGVLPPVLPHPRGVSRGGEHSCRVACCFGDSAGGPLPPGTVNAANATRSAPLMPGRSKGITAEVAVFCRELGETTGPRKVLSVGIPAGPRGLRTVGFVCFARGPT